MTLGDLFVLYAAAGFGSASLVYRASPARGRHAAWSAVLAVPLWPLWLPVALQARRREESSRPDTSDATRAAIWEAHEAVVGSALEPLLPRDAALRMLDELSHAAERHRELKRLLEKPEFDALAAERRVEQLVQNKTSARGLAPARLQLENIRRLDGLRRRDEQTLQELGELTAALRTQLVVARYSGGAPTDASDIVSEVWARVEVLGSTLEHPLGSSFGIGHGPDQAHLAG